jgi:hypothetical protein
MTDPRFVNMIPVPVCEYCASGDVAHDDLASVAVCIVTSEANSLTEYLCADHAALLFPTSWRTLSAIDPEALSTVARYSVGSGKFAPVFRFLPVGPRVNYSDGWTDGHGRITYDDGTPRPYCDECGHWDGWHDSLCQYLDTLGK